LLAAEGGGVHLRGASSTGKSTALSLAASTWGPPEYVRTWRATDNALEGIAAQHSDLLLCLDELGELPARVAGATAYMLANGSGKSRAHRDGSARAAARWRVLFLSTGEIGLGDLIAEAGGRARAGQEVRVIDLPADAGAGLGMFERLPEGMTAGAFADRLRDAAATHYGHAGPAFVARLVAQHAEARDGLRTARDAIAATLAPADAAGQVRRVAQRFALIAAAGELATDWGLTGWNAGESAHAAAVCFRAWLGARGTAGAAEPAAMLTQVRRFLEAHGESRFAPWDALDGRATINRAGFRREAGDGSGVAFYVLPEAFKSDMCAGFDHRAVARALADAGALTPDTDGGHTKPHKLPGLGLTRCVRINSAIWGTGNA
jgi:putative DNA primase/helicase